MLQSLTNAGIRVALIDGSCYSGATQARKSDNICVISSQTASRTARTDSEENGTFLNAFCNELRKSNPQKKVSLEEAFLAARSQKKSLDSSWKYDRPEISSSQAQNILSPLFELFDNIRNSVKPSCEVYSDNLTKQATQILSVSNQVFQNMNKELVNKLKKYEIAHNESLLVDKQLWAAQLSSNKEHTQELSQKAKQLHEVENKIRTEINEMEVALYKKHHQEHRVASDQADPCRDFYL